MMHTKSLVMITALHGKPRLMISNRLISNRGSNRGYFLQLGKMPKTDSRINSSNVPTQNKASYTFAQRAEALSGPPVVIIGQSSGQ